MGCWAATGMATPSKRATRAILSLLFCFFTYAAAGAESEADSPGESPFPLLPGLEKSVAFWTRIFTEFSLSQLVFFDPLDMSRIYEVIDVGEGHRSREYIDEQRLRIAAAHGVDPERVRAQRGVKERTEAGLKRSGRYLAQMQEIFRDRGLPVELTYLPIVESSFDLNARSHVGALGMWQFMRGTGREFKLRIGRGIDERKDPLESTRAAAALLEQNHRVLGNWPLAITAYNYGQTGMARAVAEVGSDNLVDLIEKYEHRYWGFPPKNFYAEFLAAVEIGKNLDRYFPGLQLDPPATIREMEVKNRASLATLLKATGLSETQFFEWNPALARSTRLVPAGYRVKFPADKPAETMIAAAPSRETRATASAGDDVVRHRVRPGETIVNIARRYGTSAEKILKVNGIRKPSLLRAGTTLVIPKI